MRERILRIIDHATAGNKAAFAAELGWSPQYLNNILSGKGLGLTPVVTIIAHHPEINARWLLIGEGDMLEGEQRRVVNSVLTRAIERAALLDATPDDERKYGFLKAIKQLSDAI